MLGLCCGHVGPCWGHVELCRGDVGTKLWASCMLEACWRHVGGMLRPCCVLEMLAPGQGPKRDFCHFPLPCEDG